MLYDNGTRTFIDLDQDNSQPWSQAWFSYDAQGRLDTQDVIYDDGSHIFYNYDQAGTEPFAVNAIIYNPDGSPYQQVTSWDDGSTTYILLLSVLLVCAWLVMQCGTGSPQSCLSWRPRQSGGVPARSNGVLRYPLAVPGGWGQPAAIRNRRSRRHLCRDRAGVAGEAAPEPAAVGIKVDSPYLLSATVSLADGRRLPAIKVGSGRPLGASGRPNACGQHRGRGRRAANETSIRGWGVGRHSG